MDSSDMMKLMAAAIIAAIAGVFSFFAGQKTGQAALMNAISAANGGVIRSLQDECLRLARRQVEQDIKIDECEARHEKCEAEVRELRRRVDAQESAK